MRRMLALAALIATTACVQQEPFFASVLLPQDTYDELGPYRIEVYVVAPEGVQRLLARLTDDPESGIFAERAFEPLDPEDEEGVWILDLAGRPAGTELWYHLLLVDETGSLLRDPQTAPVDLHFFQVLNRS